MTQRRTDDGQRTGFASLSQGGFNWESLPLKLFRGGMEKTWNPASWDFSTDAQQWAALTDEERFLGTLLCASFVAGEEAVAQDIQPFMHAMAEEGRMGDELYLTQFAFEESRHTVAFRLWLDAVGIKDDLHSFVDYNDGYRRIFYDELPRRLNALLTDPSPEAQVRASVTYNHVVEGMLALTGYHAWNKVCLGLDILPGMQALVRHIGDDERRHMAWGTFTCRRHVAADDRMWDVVADQMQALMAPALKIVSGPYEQFPEQFSVAEQTFAIPVEEMVAYAYDHGSRRLGTIESARGRPVQEIDVDYEPAVLEERFAEEDALLLVG